MISKRYVTRDHVPFVAVNFVLPESVWATKIHLVGDFNNWDRTSLPFQRDHDGKWILTVTLPLGHVYQFRYLLDGSDWTNESNADGFVPNRFGSENGLIITDPAFHPHLEPGELHDVPGNGR